MSFSLKKHAVFPGRPGPLLLVVLDGVGVGAHDDSDAVWLARTPHLDRLTKVGLGTTLLAHGTAVGLPSDTDMGNSEVGHNALGCGRVYEQGARLVNQAIADGALFRGAVWQKLVERCKNNQRAMHFIGLLSDGNVHSHIDHLCALLRQAAAQGVKRLFVHALLDGRDVPGTSAPIYLSRLAPVLAETGARIASGGGRMCITMDRYGADWQMVERGYRTHVHGESRPFASAKEAIETFRQEQDGILDQDLPAFVVVDDGQPIGRIVSGDAVVLHNFRGDRAIEISQAFEQGDEFDKFDRTPRPDVAFAGMMQYDGDLLVPTHYLVSPPAIERTMGEYLVRNNVSQLAISETQKYGHVTYFWNGNRSGMFDDTLEKYIEVPSDNVAIVSRPKMRAVEITDGLLEQVTGSRFVRVNYANGDMVGHTGDRDACVLAVEAVDQEIGRLMSFVQQQDGVLIVTADHGNADEMYLHDKSGAVLRDKNGTPLVKTSHTLNPVPFLLYDPRAPAGEYTLENMDGKAGIANVTATCLNLLGFAQPDDEEPSLLRFR